MKLGMLTGGGDCAGLNAAVRAVARAAAQSFGTTVVGYQRGWNGLLDGDSIVLDPDVVRGILPIGGTMLGTSRSKPSLLENGPDPLINQLEKDGVDALIAIGGDGTLRTTAMLAKAGFPVIAVPKTIDNDVPMTDTSIGFDTALAVATDAVDRLHTTAQSHNRLMVLEVMGRHAGHVAAGAGIAGGAAAVLVPEEPFHIEDVAAKLTNRHSYGRSESIVVVAEGATPADDGLAGYRRRSGDWGQAAVGGIGALVAGRLEQLTGFESRTTVLGHIQRGGSPTPTDRIVAAKLGAGAVDALIAGHNADLIGIAGRETCLTPLADVSTEPRLLSSADLRLLNRMTTVNITPVSEIPA